MHVAGFEAEPVHRREVSDGVGHLGVLDQLGLAGGAGGEVQQQPVLGGGARVLRRWDVEPVCVVERRPALGRGLAAGDREAAVVAGHLVELGGVGGVGDDEPGAPAVDPVAQVGRSGRRGRRHDHRAELDDPEHRLPELDLVAEHDDDRVALGDALLGQPRRDLVGPPGHGVVGPRLRRCPSAASASSRIIRAGRSLPRAMASNQSTAQLKRSPTSGHRNPETAARWSPRQPMSWLRDARKASVAGEPAGIPAVIVPSRSAWAPPTSVSWWWGARR